MKILNFFERKKGFNKKSIFPYFIDNLQAKCQELIDANGHLNSKMSKLGEENFQLVSRNEELKTELASSEEKITELETKKWQLEESLEVARKDFENAKVELQQFETKAKDESGIRAIEEERGILDWR